MIHFSLVQEHGGGGVLSTSFTVTMDMQMLYSGAMLAYVKCPIVGRNFCVKSPTIRGGGGVVGQHIDRCISAARRAVK